MRYRRNLDVLWRSTSSGPVVLLPTASDPLLLRGPAASLWELLDEAATAAELAVMAAPYGVDQDSAIEALQEVVDLGLVVVS